MAIFPGSAIPSAISAYDIDNSVRFNAGDSTVLARTNSSGGNRRKATWSFWIKPGNLGTSNRFMWLMLDGAVEFGIDFVTADNLDVFLYDGGYTMRLLTTQVFRDPSSWYHIVIAMDTEQDVASDRVKMYVNGSQVTSFSTETYMAEDTDTPVNKISVEQKIGSSDHPVYFSMYLAEFYFIDGTQYAPSDFGELSSTTNQWIPIDAKDDLTFGTNGFYQKYGSTELANSFADSAGPTINTFTSSGTLTVPDGGVTADILLVAGGGAGGGSGHGAGGGGGGVIYKTGHSLAAGTYSIVVGGGGVPNGTTVGGDGDNTTGISMTAFGGGGGGNNSADAADGGSGGGGGAETETGGTSTQTSNGGGTGYGNDGGDGAAGGGNYGSGGGGGAGAVGETKTDNGGGDGGVGISNSISGSAVFYGGGGGGAAYSGGGAGGTGGNGGGGDGETYNTGNQTAGTNGLGGGGGGNGGYASPGSGMAGGSGVAIISWNLTAGSGHTITANGDVTQTRAVKKVGDSSIYFDGTGDYLSIPDSSDWYFDTSSFCMEGWVYRSVTDGHDRFMGQKADDTNRWYFEVSTSDNIGFYIQVGGSDLLYAYSTGGELPHGAWHHLAATWDGTTFRMFVDGTSVTLTTGTSYAGTFPDIASILTIGVVNISHAEQYFEGYMDEIRVSDTARYTANFTTFGQGGGTIANPTPFTADANTLLLIHSNWNGGLGADSSGNTNDFAATNLVATDQMVDTPTNNFCTWNPLSKRSGGAEQVVLSEGNLKGTTVDVSGAYQYDIVSTMAVSTGKFYVEQYIIDLDSTQQWFVGIVTSGVTAIPRLEASVNSCYKMMGYANKRLNGTNSSYGEVFATGDILGIAYNGDDNEITFYKNNSSMGAISINADEYLFLSGKGDEAPSWVTNFGQDSSFAGNKTAQGNQDANEKGDFYYAPPTNYLALCTSNISSPEIALPGKNFNPVLYDGTASELAVTGAGFQADFTWIKNRSLLQKPVLFDVIRGVTKVLSSYNNEAQGTDLQGLKSWQSDGFTVGTEAAVNYPSSTFVSWNWKAGTTFDPATDGSVVTGSGSSNSTAGFSIIKYEGTGSTMTVGHNLSVAPELIIVKNMDAADAWQVYCASNGSAPETDYLVLNTTAATVDNVDRWNDTPPSATVFTVGDGVEVNTDDEDYIVYCFHSVEGYSKVGGYEGNGNVDGSFIYTGFRPAFIMTKSIDSTSDWQMFDDKREGYNVDNDALIANDNDIEVTTDYIDIVSNGFKNRIATDPNVAETYIYLAFAESPFKTSNAR